MQPRQKQPHNDPYTHLQLHYDHIAILWMISFALLCHISATFAVSSTGIMSLAAGTGKFSPQPTPASKRVRKLHTKWQVKYLWLCLELKGQAVPKDLLMGAALSGPGTALKYWLNSEAGGKDLNWIFNMMLFDLQQLWPIGHRFL